MLVDAITILKNYNHCVYVNFVCLPLKGENHVQPWMMQALMSSRPKKFIEGLQFWNIRHLRFLEKKMADSVEKVDSYMMEDEAH